MSIHKNSSYRELPNSVMLKVKPSNFVEVASNAGETDQIQNQNQDQSQSQSQNNLENKTKEEMNLKNSNCSSKKKKVRKFKNSKFYQFVSRKGKKNNSKNNEEEEQEEGNSNQNSVRNAAKQEKDDSKQNLTPNEKFLIAARLGNIEELTELYKSEAINVNYTSQGTLNKQLDKVVGATLETAMHFAASNNHVDAVRFLCELQADVDQADSLGSTALHRACSIAAFDVVKELLDQHANLHAHNKIGNIPLHSASYCGHQEIMELLLQRSSNPVADLTYPNNVGMTPLDYLRSPETREEMQKYFINKQSSDVLRQSIIAEEENDQQTTDSNKKPVNFDQSNSNISSKSECSKSSDVKTNANLLKKESSSASIIVQ